MDEKIYAKIKLIGHGGYIQEIDKLNVLIDEIKAAAEGRDLEATWNIRLVEMDEEEYKNLPEFAGY